MQRLAEEIKLVAGPLTMQYPPKSLDDADAVFRDLRHTYNADMHPDSPNLIIELTTEVMKNGRLDAI
ncbi:MAG: hypothetical protein H8E66_01270 [Planctomycetes bacterium]|nr:hypothetical protein [Planctomycetota bacterium]